MNNCDLASEFLSQIRQLLDQHGVSSEALETLRKRFKHAGKIIASYDASLLAPLLADCNLDKQGIIQRLEQFDEAIYVRVHNFLSSQGIMLNAIGDETVKDILQLICREYCGEGKPFRKMLIIFDEFGHYAEFATTHCEPACDNDPLVGVIGIQP